MKSQLLEVIKNPDRTKRAKALYRMVRYYRDEEIEDPALPEAESILTEFQDNEPNEYAKIVASCN